MSDATTIFNSPREFLLSGKKYLVSKHTLKQEGEMVAYARSQYPDPAKEMQEQNRILADGDAALYRELSIKAHESLRDMPRELLPRTIEFMDRRFLNAFQTPNGIRKLISLALKPKHPEVTDELIDDIFLNAEENERELNALNTWFMFGKTIEEVEMASAVNAKKPLSLNTSEPETS